jgi:hypothetical protein
MKPLKIKLIETNKEVWLFYHIGFPAIREFLYIKK